MHKPSYLFFVVCLLFSVQVSADRSRFSGNPLPRFVSLRFNNINTRIGPSLEYPLKYTYNYKFQPVKIINEYFDWYEIEDINKDTSWIYKNNLSAGRYVITIKASLLYEDEKFSDIVANIAKGSLFKLHDCKDNLCKVETNFNNTNYKGYIFKSDLWGV